MPYVIARSTPRSPLGTYSNYLEYQIGRTLVWVLLAARHNESLPSSRPVSNFLRSGLWSPQLSRRRSAPLVSNCLSSGKRMQRRELQAECYQCGASGLSLSLRSQHTRSVLIKTLIHQSHGQRTLPALADSYANLRPHHPGPPEKCVAPPPRCFEPTKQPTEARAETTKQSLEPTRVDKLPLAAQLQR